MQREQAMVREIASMISFIACCHSAKLCAHAARDFRSQQRSEFFKPNRTFRSGRFGLSRFGLVDSV